MKRQAIQAILAIFFLIITIESFTKSKAFNTTKRTYKINYPIISGGKKYKIDSPTKGGKGGKIIKVTNLKSKGKGSFRAAVNTPGRRIIVFEVGGVIDLAKHGITINQPNITIAGQTAPSPGITFIRGDIYIVADDVIVRDIAVRSGDAGEPKRSGYSVDAISVRRSRHVWVDHCSAMWATDENMSTEGPSHNVDSTSHHITFSNNLIAEGLLHSSHSGRNGTHSKGSLIEDNSRDITIVRNLYANNKDRNPYFKIGSTGIVANNLIYNPGDHIIHTQWVKREWTEENGAEGYHAPPPLAKITVIGNVLIPGPDTEWKDAFVEGNYAKVYIKDNKIMGNRKDIKMMKGTFERVDFPPIWHKGIKIMKADQVRDYVLTHVGSRPADRRAIDQRIIEGVKRNTGIIIDTQRQVGGYPHLKPTYRKLTIPRNHIQQWLNQMADSVNNVN